MVSLETATQLLRVVDQHANIVGSCCIRCTSLPRRTQQLPTLLGQQCNNLEQIVNSELNNVSDWLLANKLTLNFKKSNYVLFRPRQKCLTYNPSIKAYNPAINALSTLEQKDFVKYLGVLIDYELS